MGNPRVEIYVNPWPEMIRSVLDAPDAHTLEAIRVLYYAAHMYGKTSPGGMIGAYLPDGMELHAGMAKVDGTIFVMAVGV